MTYSSGISQPFNPKQTYLCQNGIVSWSFFYSSPNSEPEIKKIFCKALTQNCWQIPCYGFVNELHHPSQFLLWTKLQNFRNDQIYLKGRVLGLWGKKSLIVNFQNFSLILPIKGNMSIFSSKFKYSYGKVLTFKISKKNSSRKNLVIFSANF